jgi:hypothetical protein
VGCPQGSSTFGWQIVSGANLATGSFTPPSAGTFTLACFVNSETGVGLWASGCKIVVSTSFTAQEIIGNPTVTPFTPTAYLVNQVSGHTYQWTVTGGAIANGQGTNFVNVVWSNTGPYSIQLIESNGVCSDISVLDLGVVTGILEENANGINIYPNPAADFVIISVDKPIGRWIISDLKGKVVLSGMESTTNATISLEALSTGFYLLSMPLNILKPTPLIVQ